MDRGRRRRKAWALLAACLLVRGRVAAPAWACRLAVLGDSLAAGYGVAEAEAFPARLERRCAERGAPATVLNAGVSGDTSAGGAARLDWVLADQPTHLLVELGGNDALRGLPVDQLRANLEQIVATARSARRAGDAGRHAGAAQSRPRPTAMPSGRSITMSRAEHDIPLYPFFLDGAVLQDGLMQPDGIHPNARGVEVIVERIAPLVADSLKERLKSLEA